MPSGRECNDEVDALKAIKRGRMTHKVCEDCADRIQQKREVAKASEGVVQHMMGFKGRR